jgi:hypothetical protein
MASVKPHGLGRKDNIPSINSAQRCRMADELKDAPARFKDGLDLGSAVTIERMT